MENLIKVVNELNDKLGLDPEIKTKGVDEKKLKKDLKKAADLIDWENDHISPESGAELASIGVEVPVENLPIVEEPIVEESTADISIDKLVSLTRKTSKLEDAKKIINKHSVFLPLRKKLPGLFDIEELKEMMLDLLNSKKIKPAADKPAADKPKKTAVKSRAATFSEIIKENKPRTLLEINEEMIARSPQSSAKGQIGFTRLYVNLLKELGVLIENEKGLLIMQ